MRLFLFRHVPSGGAGDDRIGGKAGEPVSSAAGGFISVFDGLDRAPLNAGYAALTVMLPNRTILHDPDVADRAYLAAETAAGALF
jgi:hypothetical protein